MKSLHIERDKTRAEASQGPQVGLQGSLFRLRLGCLISGAKMARRTPRPSVRVNWHA